MTVTRKGWLIKPLQKGILIQARLSSSRFPGKMLNSLGHVPLLRYVFQRCKMSLQAGFVGVITSLEKSDDPLYHYCIQHDMPVFRGSLNNVLDRYIQAAQYFECDIVCRVCGDSPFVDTAYIDKLFEAMKEDTQYLAVKGGLNGFFSEVIALQTLKKVQALTKNCDDLEHVTRYIRNHIQLFNHKIIDMGKTGKKFKDITLTIDYEQDLKLANLIIAQGLYGYGFVSEDVIRILDKHYDEFKKVMAEL